MTDARDADTSGIETARRRIARAAFRLVVAGLAGGIALYLANQTPASAVVLAATIGVLLVLPLLNVFAVLAEEIRQRDWGFAWLAVAVMALLGYAIVSKVVQALQFRAG